MAAIPEDPSAPEETFVFDGLVIASGTNNWACLPQFDGEHNDIRMHIIRNGLIDEEIDTQETSNGVYTTTAYSSSTVGPLFLIFTVTREVEVG
jgi:hypothetical protein